MPRRTFNPTAHELQALVQRYESGVSLRALSKEVSISVPTLRRQLMRGGAAIRDRGRPKGTGVPHKVVSSSPPKPEPPVSESTNTESLTPPTVVERRPLPPVARPTTATREW